MLAPHLQTDARTAPVDIQGAVDGEAALSLPVRGELHRRDRQAVAADILDRAAETSSISSIAPSSDPLHLRLLL